MCLYTHISISSDKYIIRINFIFFRCYEISEYLDQNCEDLLLEENYLM